MALAPRSSLRSLLLLMSHGRPQLSSFFSSSVTATGVPPAAPGADTPPAAPAVHPPVTTAPPDRSCQKLPGGPRTYKEETVLQPLPGRPRPPRAVTDVTDKACLNATEDPSAYPTPDHGSSSTPEPVSDKPPWGILEDPRHPVRGAPPRTRSVGTDEPVQCTQEHSKYPIPDSSTETEKGRVEEHPIYTAPGYGSCSTREAEPVPVPVKPPKGISEDVKDPVRDPPRRPKAVIDQPAQCTQEHPKYPIPDSSSDKGFSSCSPAAAAAPRTCSPAAPDV